MSDIETCVGCDYAELFRDEGEYYLGGGRGCAIQVLACDSTGEVKLRVHVDCREKTTTIRSYLSPGQARTLGTALLAGAELAEKAILRGERAEATVLAELAEDDHYERTTQAGVLELA